MGGVAPRGVKGKALSAPQGRVVETDDAEALEASAVRHKAALEAVGATAFWLHLCRQTKVENRYIATEDLIIAFFILFVA